MGSTHVSRLRGTALSICLCLAAGAASAQTVTERVLNRLQGQGFETTSVQRTWLGRVRVEARSADGQERELVFNPRTGEILRDFREDYDDDDDEEEDFDNEDDPEEEDEDGGDDEDDAGDEGGDEAGDEDGDDD